ncbi:hypothetical protein P4V43_09220 [Brevibacillus fortis]|nr:hypothetical protein [Brevibacillus fortis]
MLWDVYGTVNESAYRQYRYAYPEMPKKNGKTTMIVIQPERIMLLQ